ncbi:putative ribosomal protein S19e [Lupinus albus]|uniref:Putative ribosomal protein S19e n=1 Tax=Lupinus albus TaxID=3870 RepID=A0A6A4NRR5_LUPAL|nr:putative ribosomal protein S19e [Lupinus albus]
MATAKTVKDVSPHEFVKAYSSHLKRSGKVSFFSFYLCNFNYFLMFHVSISFGLF